MKKKQNRLIPNYQRMLPKQDRGQYWLQGLTSWLAT